MELAPSADKARSTAAVTVAYVHPDEVTASWHQSLMSLIGFDLANEARVLRGGWVAVRCAASASIPEARNSVVETFLADRDAEWLWWIDTDMGFAPDTIERLLEAADPETRPIVGGLCFARKHIEDDGMGGWRAAIVPTIYDWADVPDTDGKGFISRSGYAPDALVQCAGTGSACLLVHRSVYERITASGRGACYDRVPNNGGMISEDLSFCLRAGALGIPVWVHTGVRTTHFKPAWIGEDDFLAQAALQELVAEPRDA
jgi:hypothetical protein